MLTFPAGVARPSFVNLMNLLRSAAGGGAVAGVRGPNLRIGGNSADKSAYVPAGTPLPLNDTYRITGADFAAYAAAVPLWNGSITPGVNFRDATSAALAVAHVAALNAAIPWSAGLVEAFEVSQ